MNDDQMRELLIRMDERGARIEQRMEDESDRRKERDAIVDKRLDSHAHDIKVLREWRNYLAGGIAVIAALVGIKSGKS